ncbi:MAG: hypothetical protein HYY52_04465 [Candidatus Melainabacteria bacterium]|nr:hypothetical protein [Candidatus Melainabacteria bacterium]
MKKTLKLYIDTSVWNFSLETDRSGSTLTDDFLQLIIKESHDVIVSDTVMAEIEDAHEPRKSNLLGLIEIVSPQQFVGKKE